MGCPFLLGMTVELSLQKEGKMPEEREKLNIWRIESRQ